MPQEGQQLFKSRDDIVQDLLNGLLARVPDAYVGEDGNIVLLFQVIGDTQEAVYMAVQITSDDMFVKTASPNSLYRHGDEFGISKHSGLKSTGTLLFTAAGGTVVDIGTEAAYDSGTGDDPLFFNTTASGTTPNPGIPSACVAADAGAGTLGAGTYEYGITFQTAAGETILGAASNALTIAINHNITLTNIPLGGPGTTARNLYQRFNGGAWAKITHAGIVAALANNTATTVTLGTSPLGGTPPTISTAEAIAVPAESDDFGAKYNVLPNTITILTDAPDGVTDVINTASFIGGADEELSEDYRERLLDGIRNPGTGSAGDIKTWAEAIDGVGNATVFPNDNLGTPTNGHVTVRISAPDGSVPVAAVVTNVLNTLYAQDMANVSFHVATFTPLVQNVTVDATAQTGYVLADITPAIQAAVTAYINAIDVGGIFRIAGVVEAVMNVIGVADVIVTSPGANVTSTTSQKFTAGTVTVV